MKRLAGLVGAGIMLVASVAFAGVVIEEKSGMKMEVVGARLFLTWTGGRIAAPDGKFLLRDGSFLMVVNGKIDTVKSSALAGHPEIGAELAREGQSTKRPQHPGMIKGFNPQPEPPGAPAVDVNQAR